MLGSILTPALIATASALVVHYVITRRSESARYPPGPLCFPLLGSLPIIIWFGGKLSKLFECCHKKYGDVSIVLYFCLLYTIDICSRNSRLVQWLGHGLRNPKAAGLNTGHFLCCWLPQLHLYYAKLMSMQCSLLSGPVGGMDTKSNANYYHYIDWPYRTHKKVISRLHAETLWLLKIPYSNRESVLQMQIKPKNRSDMISSVARVP